MPFTEFNSIDNEEQAEGFLIRNNYKEPFKYKTINPRNYIFNDPIVGNRVVTATTTIQTHNDLKFVMGDKIQLEEMVNPLTIMNFSKDVKEDQYMFLIEAINVKYILDLA